MAFFALFAARSPAAVSALAVALVAAVAVGVFGSIALVVPQNVLPRVLPNEVLGRVGAVFLTGGALATLAGAVVGPSLAQAAGYPFPADAMEAVPVGPYVNDPKHDDPGCLASPA